jgi:hypothetical protein
MKEEKREGRNEGKVEIQAVHGQEKLEKSDRTGKEGREKEVKVEVQMTCGVK